MDIPRLVVLYQHTDVWNCIKECTAETDSAVFCPYKKSIAEQNSNFGCVRTRPAPTLMKHILWQGLV